tara:strand:+ start:460 stop:618 length:159 start_codon:yes stop_codon:yes gene_type:complete
MTRLDGYDYDLLIGAVEYTSIRLNHDKEFLNDMEILLDKLKKSRPLLPERFT